jgi:hypothetical protein
MDLPSISCDPAHQLGNRTVVAVRWSAAAGVNPLGHFLQFGVYEGRSPFSDGTLLA